MSPPLQVWLVHRNEDDYINVILTANGREMAKRVAHGILRGDPDSYVVSPITESGSRTIIMVAAEVLEA
jgi:broad specificity phosphatase PhoE